MCKCRRCTSDCTCVCHRFFQDNLPTPTTEIEAIPDEGPVADAFKVWSNNG